MIHLLRATFFLVGLGALLLTGRTAAAYGGPADPCTTGNGKPSCTILRPPAPPERMAPPNAPECIVAVGGLGSLNDDGTFNELFLHLRSEYRIHRFGAADPTHPSTYDTNGSIDTSGRALLDFVRSLSGECRAIHIVAHSMGGDVADRAFSLGLSAADGVVTYLPIATPHNGALLAEILTEANDISDEGNEALRDISQALKLLPLVGGAVHDVTSDAVRDLADRTPPRLPRGVLALRQRLANDPVALLPDNSDWRFESRDRLPDLHGTVDLAADVANPWSLLLTPARVARDVGEVAASLGSRGLRTLQEIEGHGGSLVNDAIRNTTEFVIRNVALPPDDRDIKEKVLAFALSIGVMVLMVFAASKVADRLVAGVLIGTWITVPLRAVLPGWDTWWEKSFPNLLVRTTGTLAKDDLLSEGQRHALPYVKGVVTRLQNEVDRLAEQGVVDDDHRPPIHEMDPRAAFVRAVLDRAASVLKQL